MVVSRHHSRNCGMAPSTTKLGMYLKLVSKYIFMLTTSPLNPEVLSRSSSSALGYVMKMRLYLAQLSDAFSAANENKNRSTDRLLAQGLHPFELHVELGVA